jgi:hypothetical protein
LSRKFLNTSVILVYYITGAGSCQHKKIPSHKDWVL